jgi:fructose-1,6-bisphosphatase/inositol monophosphatase family enzyme
MSSLLEDLTFASALARKLGRMVTFAGRVGDAVVKGDGTPQTSLDRAVNAAFRTEVGEHRPDDLALGEEDTEEHRTPPPGARVWVCDPVDGTWLLPFGLPYTVVSVALVVDGVPAVGVVLDPHTGRSFEAVTGGGAYEAGHRLQVNTVRGLRGSVLALPCGNVPGMDVAGMHHAAVRSGADLLSVGSAIHDATLVLGGFAAGYIYPYSSPWDMAAVACLIGEAGGRITALDGTVQRYDQPIRGAVVSNGFMHNTLLGLVARHRTG